MSNTTELSRKEIWKMFDQISSTYDTVNRAMTFGIDKHWRGKMAMLLPDNEKMRLLDLATGTADQIITLLKRSPKIDEAVGIDLSTEMLNIGRKKLSALSFGKKVILQEASALDLPFANGSFDCVTMSFGIRNVTSVEKCLSEMFRVLKSGGRALILEGSLPKNPIILKLHLFYLRHLLPTIGGLISKQKDAYVYLNKTLETFPSGEAFCNLLQNAGFRAKAHPMTFGAVSIYQGDKP